MAPLKRLLPCRAAMAMSLAALALLLTPGISSARMPAGHPPPPHICRGYGCTSDLPLERLRPHGKGSDTLINFVLDKSGSMQSRLDATIKGFNTFLAGQKSAGKELDAKTYFSLTLFDTAVSHPYTDVDISTVPDLTTDSYQPGGATALYDAIGQSIHTVENMADQPSKIMFVILTDGQENSSTEYSRSQIFSMIAANREAGWQFVFLGADENAYAGGSAIGVTPGAMMSYKSAHSKAMFGALDAATTRWRAGRSAQVTFGAAARKAAGGPTVHPGRVVPVKAPGRQLGNGPVLSGNQAAAVATGHPSEGSGVLLVLGLAVPPAIVLLGVVFAVRRRMVRPVAS